VSNELSDFLKPIKIKNYSDVKEIIKAILAKKRELERKKNDEKQLREDLENVKQKLEKLTNETSSEHNRIKTLSLQYLKEAIEYHLNKEYEKAIKKYQTSIDMVQDNALALGNWGLALLDLARLKNDESLYRESIKKYKKAIELNPNNFDAFKMLDIAFGELIRLENDKKRAVRISKKLKKLNSQQN
jgi:tetratricopeptide (TPR) repeat protein